MAESSLVELRCSFTIPLIFTALLEATGNPISPALYLIAVLAGIVAALTFPETAREPLREM